MIGLLASVIGLVARPRDREGHDRAVQRASASTCPKAATVVAAQHDASSRSCSARASRCSRASCPRGGRPACRRSRPSARARRCRSRGSPRTRARPASASSAGSRRRDLGRHLRRRSAPVAIGAAARRRRARPVRRHRAARAAPRQAARRASSAGRRAAPAASPASWPARTPSATRPHRVDRRALMIGLTLVTVVAVLGAGLQRVDARRRQRPAPRGLRGRRRPGGCRSAADGGRRARARRRRQGRLARALRQGARAGQGERRHRHRPGRRSRASTTFDWAKGSEQSLGQLGTDGALVTKTYADEHAPGGRRASSSLDDALGRRSARYVVRGHLRPAAASARCSATSASASRRSTPLHERRRTASRSSTPDAARRPALEAAVDGLRRRQVPHRRGVPEGRTKDIATFLAMLYVLLGFSVIVSLFGMVNTLVLSVFERTRELGMLRAIGMTRRQARRMIRHESVITALIGAALGLGLGVFLAALVDAGAVGLRPRADAARHGRSSPSRSSPSWPGSGRRSCRPAAPRGSTC